MTAVNCFRHDKDSAKMAVRPILLAYDRCRSAHIPGFGDRRVPRRVPNSNLCPYLVVVRPDCRLILDSLDFHCSTRSHSPSLPSSAICCSTMIGRLAGNPSAMLSSAQRLALSVDSYAGSGTSGAEAKRYSFPGSESVLFFFGGAQPELHRLPLSPDCSPRTFLAEPIQKAHSVAEAPRVPG